MINKDIISKLSDLDKNNRDLLFNELAGALKTLRSNGDISPDYVVASDIITDILLSYTDK